LYLKDFPESISGTTFLFECLGKLTKTFCWSRIPFPVNFPVLPSVNKSPLLENDDSPPDVDSCKKKRSSNHYISLDM